jgi:hypothetical protein
MLRLHCSFPKRKRNGFLPQLCHQPISESKEQADASVTVTVTSDQAAEQLRVEFDRVAVLLDSRLCDLKHDTSAIHDVHQELRDNHLSPSVMSALCTKEHELSTMLNSESARNLAQLLQVLELDDIKKHPRTTA